MTLIVMQASEEDAMDDIKDFSVEEDVGYSKYVRVTRLHYVQNNIPKDWDVAVTHDAVACLLYHRPRQCFVLAKQFRPPVYLNHNKNGSTKHLGGVTYELCAGLIDKQGKTKTS